MRLGIRLLFAFFSSTALPRFSCCASLGRDQAQRARVMEDMMVDTAHILAELASDDLAAGTLQAGGSAFARHVQHYASRPVDAAIWGFPSSRSTTVSM